MSDSLACAPLKSIAQDMYANHEYWSFDDPNHEAWGWSYNNHTTDLEEDNYNFPQTELRTTIAHEAAHIHWLG